MLRSGDVCDFVEGDVFYLENNIQETLHNRHTSISIGGRPLCNLRFADDIALMGGSEAELRDHTTRLETRIISNIDYYSE